MRRLPAAPNFLECSTWAAFPGRLRGRQHTVVEGDAVLLGEALRPADLFFVHPTTYFGSEWNAAHDDHNAMTQLDEAIIGTQASVFNRVCRVYAPRYRQVRYSGFFAPPDEARPAFDVAYGDVRDAFETFLEVRHSSGEAGRPIVLASHSQGSLHMARLIDDVVERRPALARSVVACYCIGMGIRLDDVAARAPTAVLQPSRSPAQGNALVAWNLRAAPTRGEGNFVGRGVGPGHWARARGGWCDDPTDAALLQTSPLTWRSNAPNRSEEALLSSDVVGAAEGADAALHLGVALPSFAPPISAAAMMEDVPFNSSLVALHAKRFDAGVGRATAAKPKRARRARLPYTATLTDHEVVVGNLPPSLAGIDLGQGVGDLHAMDYGLFYLNLQANVELRVDAFLAARAVGAKV